MKFHAVAAGVVLAGLLASSPAFALTITMEPAKPVPIGQAQTFRIAKVEGAVGNVLFRWNFGEGAPTTPLPDRSATHTYQTAGHKTVFVIGEDDAGMTSASFTQVVHYPLTSIPPRNSSSIFVDAAHHRVWNVNPDSDSVSVIDGGTLKRMREIPVGDEPHSLAQAPDGTIWVANQMSDEVVVLDPNGGAIQTRIALPYASQPMSIVFSPKGVAYVSLFATGQLVEIDGTSRKVQRTVTLGPTPAAISVASNGRIYVTRFISPVDHGEVWAVSPDTFTVAKTIQLAEDPGPDGESAGRGVPNFVSSFVISPDGTQAWVTSKKDDVERGPNRDGQPSDADNFVRAIVSVVDLKTETEILEKRMDVDNRSNPVSVVFSPLGDNAYVLIMPSNWIGIYDTYINIQLGGIKDIGNAPDGLALAPDGKLFVNAFLSREVIAYDLSESLASHDQGAPPPLARIRTIDQEPLSADVLLGKKVFFNAADSRMSGAGYMSCVSCHFGGLSDGRVWDFTSRGEGLRNTKSLLGIRGIGEGRVHWSANFNEIQDFERDIRDSFAGSGFMPEAEFNSRKDADGEYDPFGAPAAGASKELDGLAAFFTSLNKVPRSPFRNPDGSFTTDALEGRQVFERAGCLECHSPPDFTDSAAGRLHDVGTILPTSGSRLHGPLTGIDTPTLKGLWQTAPYLHDGRAATLLEIFTKYLTQDQMGMTSSLTQIELAQLVEYLQELDDVPEPASPPDETPKEVQGAFRCGACELGRATRAPLGAGGWAIWLFVGPALAVLRRRRSRN